MLALHKVSCFHYTFSHFILSSDKFHFSQMLEFTKPCSPRRGVRWSIDFFSLSVIFSISLSTGRVGNGSSDSGRTGCAAGKPVPGLEFLKTSGPYGWVFQWEQKHHMHGPGTAYTRIRTSVCRDSRVQEVRIGMGTYFKVKVRETKILCKCVWRGWLLTVRLASFESCWSRVYIHKIEF